MGTRRQSRVPGNGDLAVTSRPLLGTDRRASGVDTENSKSRAVQHVLLRNALATPDVNYHISYVHFGHPNHRLPKSHVWGHRLVQASRVHYPLFGVPFQRAAFHHRHSAPRRTLAGHATNTHRRVGSNRLGSHQTSWKLGAPRSADLEVGKVAQLAHTNSRRMTAPRSQNARHKFRPKAMNSTTKRIKNDVYYLNPLCAHAQTAAGYQSMLFRPLSAAASAEHLATLRVMWSAALAPCRLPAAAVGTAAPNLHPECTERRPVDGWRRQSGER